MTRRALADLALKAMEAELIHERASSSASYADRLTSHELETNARLQSAAFTLKSEFRVAWKAEREAAYAKQQKKSAALWARARRLCVICKGFHEHGKLPAGSHTCQANYDRLSKDKA
jgi:hypothetical protein